MHESPQKQRCVFVCMELSSKLELVYILYNWICCLIFTLIYKGGTVDYSGIVISIWRLVYRS